MDTSLELLKHVPPFKSTREGLGKLAKKALMFCLGELLSSLTRLWHYVRKAPHSNHIPLNARDYPHVALWVLFCLVGTIPIRSLGIVRGTR